MEEFSALQEASKEQGHLTEDAAPIRLDLKAVQLPIASESVNATAAATAESIKPRKAVVLEGDDDEERGGRKRQTFVKLEPEKGAQAGMSIAERNAIRNAQLLEIKTGLPVGKAALGAKINWDAIPRVSSLHLSFECC